MRLIDADALKNMQFSCGMHDDNYVVYAPLREVMKNIDKAPTIGGWISTSDRMPEKDKDVLVWLYGDYCIGRYDQDPDNLQMRWKFEAFNLYEDDMSYITHWMPLPEPPEKEK